MLRLKKSTEHVCGGLKAEEVQYHHQSNEDDKAEDGSVFTEQQHGWCTQRKDVLWRRQHAKYENGKDEQVRESNRFFAAELKDSKQCYKTSTNPKAGQQTFLPPFRLCYTNVISHGFSQSDRLPRLDLDIHWVEGISVASAHPGIVHIPW